MAKAKKKPTASKAKTPAKSKVSVKKVKPATKVKAVAKPVPKSKVVAKAPVKAPLKEKEKSVKAAPVGKASKPVPEKKLTKEELKKQQKTVKDSGKDTGKKVAKPEEEIDDFDELEVIETYGDAIRLTPEDLEDPEDVYLTDADGKRYCKVKDCDQLSTVEGYCRLHYLALWKKIQTRKKILTDGKLEKYIEELTSRYPDKYIEMIRRDVKTEKDFLAAIQELEIDDSTDGEFEEDSSFIEEVRGMGAGRTGRGSGEESSGGGGEDSF